VSLIDDLMEGRPLAPSTPRPPLAPADAFRAAVAPGARDGVGSAIGPSDDLARVLALPRRAPLAIDDPNDPAVVAVVARMTARLARKNDRCTCHLHRRPCLTRLKPAQSWALAEIEEVGGLVGPIGVGHGKTGLGILAPMVLPKCRTAVLLIPPNLREQLKREYDLWSQHFHVPSIRHGGAEGTIIAGRPVIHVVPYSLFSRPESTTLLESIRPDAIIADEAHKLRDRKTATSGRVIRYMVKHPETRFLGWSGTIAKGSVVDFTHLSAFALRDGSPTPLDPNTAAAWATALDPLPVRAAPGALRQLGDGPIADVFGRRLAETKGWVATRAGAVSNALTLRERKAPEMPAALKKALAQMRSTWTRPDGEELVDVLQVARSVRELALGFFYRWRFPRGEPERLIARWFAARKDWHRELRGKLERPVEHLDSPMLAENAAARGLDGYAGPLPVWKASTYRAWREVRDEVAPVPDTVWLDDPPEGFDPIPGADYLVRDAGEWAAKHRGIVWYEHDAFGARLAEDYGLPRHAGGVGAEARILAEDGRRSIVASIKAHGTGRDGLQRVFHEQLVVPMPSSGDGCEQLLGRLHRIGQEADEVTTWCYRHVPELRDGLDKAIEQARFLRSTLGSEQKLLAATIEWDDASA
jgi:hypothetical protein